MAPPYIYHGLNKLESEDATTQMSAFLAEWFLRRLQKIFSIYSFSKNWIPQPLNLQFRQPELFQWCQLKLFVFCAFLFDMCSDNMSNQIGTKQNHDKKSAFFLNIKFKLTFRNLTSGKSQKKPTFKIFRKTCMTWYE